VNEDLHAPTGAGPEPDATSGEPAGDELSQVLDTAAALWEDAKVTAKKIIEGDLDEVPYADRPEVLIGAAFAGGLLTALIIKRLGRR
jgi:hypothetical protein